MSVIAQVFWSKVNKNSNVFYADGSECWIYKVGKSRRYGVVWLARGHSVNAHKFSWQCHFGDVPQGLCVCHKCDNTLCVNPSHLFLGSHQDNMHDKNIKCRNKSILTKNDVLKIRHLYTLGLSKQKLASLYCVNRTTISRVVNKRTWSYV